MKQKLSWKENTLLLIEILLRTWPKTCRIHHKLKLKKFQPILRMRRPGTNRWRCHAWFLSQRFYYELTVVFTHVAIVVNVVCHISPFLRGDKLLFAEKREFTWGSLLGWGDPQGPGGAPWASLCCPSWLRHSGKFLGTNCLAWVGVIRSSPV